MSRRSIRPLRNTCALFPIYFVALIVSVASHAQSETPPNVLLILTDDQGWWDVNSFGNELIETPNLTRLSELGTTLTHFYVSPVCAPTRASLMSGRHYLRTGVYNTRFGGDTMRADEWTIAEHLQGQGYRTGLFGKWHLGHYGETIPNAQGFDTFFGHHHGHIERYDYPDQLVFNEEPVEARGYVTEVFTDAALEFMGEESSQPFFCYLAYNVPHSPFIVGDAHALQEEGDKLIAKYVDRGVPLRDARIYAMIERCDKNIGRILTTLTENGLFEDTLILFLSDNGGVSRHDRLGLRGGKASAYEGGVRSPLFMTLPGTIPAGKVVEAPAHVTDLYPTICELVGLPLPDQIKLDGRSFRSRIDGTFASSTTSEHPYLFHIWDRYEPSLSSRWSIHETESGWKLVGNQLFRLTNDPGERTNLAAEHPEVAKRLRKRFSEWLDDVTAGQAFQPVPIVVGEGSVELQVSWIDRDWADPENDQPHYEFRAYDWDTLDGWNEGDAVTWNLDFRNPGTYAVEISYGAFGSEAGGSYSLTLGSERLKGDVVAGLNHNTFVKHHLGTVTIAEPGPQTLQFRAESIAGRDLMALNRIWLRPVADD